MSLFDFFRKKSEIKTDFNTEKLPKAPAGSYIEEINTRQSQNALSPDECAFTWRVNADDGSVNESVKVDYANVRFPKNLWIDDFSKVVFPTMFIDEKEDDI